MKKVLSIILLMCFVFSFMPQTVYADESITVTSEEELIAALNKSEVVDEINITNGFSVKSDCTIQYDAAHINYYSDTVVTVKEGVTLTVGNGGIFGSFWPSYEGDGETPPFPNGKVINNGKIIVENGGAIEADLDTNNGEIIIKDGGFSVACEENNGTVTVNDGGHYATSMGRDAFNNGTVNIENGAVMESRFGSKIINEVNGVINLDGTFYCGCLGMDGNDIAWFENNGNVNGNGSVIIYEADRSVAPVGNMDGLIEVIMDELGQTTRFENWDDINIFKKLEVSDFNELKSALPAERTVAGEHVEGNMDVIVELANDITIPSGESIEYMTKFIVPDGITLTIADGAVLSCGMENDGCVNVLSGGELSTTMGGAIINRNELSVNEGAELKSQMGGEVINESNATLTLDGTFNCGCYGFEGTDTCWFINSGTVNGNGSINLYQADAESMPVIDMDALAESVNQMTVGSDISVEIEGWKPTLFAYVDGVQVDPSEPYKLEKGKSVFVTFFTLDENVNHGYAPIAGWADCYPGGMLSSAGFSVTEGNASDFGYNAVEDWGFGSDPHGFLLSSGDLEPGATGDIDYFLYICDNFSWDTFDFVTTPHGLTETLTFEVTKPAPKFETQPQGGVIAINQNGLTVSWKTNFKPVKQELYYVWDELIREIPNNAESLVLTEKETDSFIRSYYGTGENDYIDSEPIVIFNDFNVNVPGNVYPEYGNTSLQKIGSLEMQTNAVSELGVNVYVPSAKLVNVNDATDSHPLALYRGEENRCYISFGGENFTYVENLYSNLPVTTLAGERNFVYIPASGTKEELAEFAEVIPGKIVVLDRGGISFSEKCQNAADAGAAAVIVVNNSNNEIGMLLDGYSSNKPAICVIKAFSDAIKAKATYVGGEHPYYTGTLTVGDKDSKINILLPADVCYLNNAQSSPTFELFVKITDWSAFKKNAVYKAVISYTAIKNDYTDKQLLKSIPEQTVIVVHNHTADKGTVTKKATYTATGIKTYKCTVCGKTMKTEVIPKLEKKRNTLTVKVKKPIVNLAKLKKKNQSIARKNALTVSNAKGTVTYAKKGGNSKITVNKKNGKITVKKGLKKGTYKLKIAITASGNAEYKPLIKTVTVKITVK